MMKENEGGMAQSIEFPVRPGEKDCQFYLRTGRCGYGERCHYNHPKEIPEKINLPKCKYFLRGSCRFGSTCVYDHSKEGDDAEPMRQGQKRHITESSQSPEKRAKTIEKLRKEAEDNPKEENLRFLNRKKKKKEQLQAQQQQEMESQQQQEFTQQAQESLQRQNTERSPRREIEESEEEQRMKGQEQADMERQVREAEEKAQEQLRRDTEREKDQLLAQQQQQESPPPPQQQHQSLASQFDLFPLVEKLADAVETGTRDTNSDALVTELSSRFNKSLQLLNSISGSLGSRNMTVSGEKRKLKESKKLLQQRRDSKVDYKKSVEDILKREP